MICGSDVDVVFYYFVCLVEVGDLVSICCCLMVIGYEDIGLGNFVVVVCIVNVVLVVEWLGLFEVCILLVDVVVDFCLLLKFNFVYMVLDVVFVDIWEGKVGNVFDYLRDSYYKGVKFFNCGVGY